MKTHFRLIALLGLSTPFSVCPPIAAHAQTARSSATATVNGRTIRATGEGFVSVKSDGKGATIALGTHVVVVEAQSLRVDENDAVTLPATAKTIDISWSAGALSISVDGQVLDLSGN